MRLCNAKYGASDCITCRATMDVSRKALWTADDDDDGNDFLF